MATQATASAQHEVALDRLRPYAGVISGGATRHAAVELVPDTWRSWTAGTPAASAVETILEDHANGSIDRAALARLAKSAHDPESRLQLLVATLVWGRGKSNGRMRPHMMKTLTHDRRDEVLSRTQELALDGSLSSAYTAWDLPGLGPAFFTKWLWSSTLTRPAAKRGLILDSRVWATLNGPLTWSSIVATSGNRRRAARYAAFVDSARRWAAELSTSDRAVTPEDIEWALFAANGDLHRLRT